MNTEEIAMTLVSSAGDARSACMEALQEAAQGHYDVAKERIQYAGKTLQEGHKLQTQLIFDEMNHQSVEISLLLIHAEDHLMTAMLARDLVEHILGLYDQINQLSNPA